jgi:putative colanic acid biosysnthesis UDP-glucose lipid carrier transferase
MQSTAFNGILRQSGGDLARLQRLGDPLVAAGLFQLLVGQYIPEPSPLLLPSWLWVLALTAFLLPSGGMYGSFRQGSLKKLSIKVANRWLAVLMAILFLTYITKSSEYFGRISLALWAVSTLSLLLFSHIFLRKLLRIHRIRGGNSRTILYWGSAEAAGQFNTTLKCLPWLGLRFYKWFSPNPIHPDNHPKNLPQCSGGLSEMRRWLSSNEVDSIVFSHLPSSEISIVELLDFLGDTCLPVIYAPHWATKGMRFDVEQFGETYCINLWGGEQSRLNTNIKRIFDIFAAGSGLVLLSPLLLIIAICIKLSSRGPIFFSQERYGMNGKRFMLLKFRSMKVVEPGSTPGLRQATKDDPRVTPIGKFIRRWSIDELPQLINVLRGEMSIVGPRPHAVDHNESYRRLIPGYMQRHAFKPGLTGLAQVEGWRGETPTLETMANRVEADLRYQREWRFNLDMAIILRTVVSLVNHQAY